MMRRALSLLLTVILALGVALTTSPQVATADGIVRPHTGVGACGLGSQGVETVPATAEEASYNEELTLCDWGQYPSPDQLARYSFTNYSPVVWAFYDSNRTGLTPASNKIHYKLAGTVAVFRQFAIDAKISPTVWIVAPGETVWLESLANVAFGIATPLINSSWLLYKQQSDKVTNLGTSFAKRIATTGYQSKTRTFLWNCVAAGITTKNTLKAGSNRPPIELASSWLSTAKSDGQCVDSFTALFPKKSSKLSQSTTSVTKWFSTKNLSTAVSFLDDIKEARAASTIIDGLINVHIP
jgi:hypothetical protein